MTFPKFPGNKRTWVFGLIALGLVIPFVCILVVRQHNTQDGSNTLLLHAQRLMPIAIPDPGLPQEAYLWFSPNEIVVYNIQNDTPVRAYLLRQKRVLQLNATSPEALDFANYMNLKNRTQYRAEMPVLEWSILNYIKYSKSSAIRSGYFSLAGVYYPVLLHVSNGNQTLSPTQVIRKPQGVFQVVFGSAKDHCVLQLTDVMPRLPVPPNQELHKCYPLPNGSLYLTSTDRVYEETHKFNLPRFFKRWLRRLGIKTDTDIIHFATVYTLWYSQTGSNRLQNLGCIVSDSGTVIMSYSISAEDFPHGVVPADGSNLCFGYITEPIYLLPSPDGKAVCFVHKKWLYYLPLPSKM
ncbi:MAG TPA: hypothetical protein VKV18_11460 [Chthonomonas sp.]|uniref:hypothetical protein n=1 Tax=Chthonomonas sp. TaxID=2282153 RepID=UPI002B4B2976|nr:hypothetical protein [Chthonomonas sp.]HLI49289.1 hypothetical protein [Chthonomonas sp.]